MLVLNKTRHHNPEYIIAQIYMLKFLLFESNMEIYWTKFYNVYTDLCLNIL